MLKGEVIADGPCTDHGELALGRNVLVAFMPVSYTHLDVYKRQVIRSLGLRGSDPGVVWRRETSLPHWKPGPDNEIKKFIT